MAEDKWANLASYIVLFLGYYINSRSMTVTWPLYKRQALYADIQTALASPRTVTPRMTASIIGKVRAAGEIAPWGPYISFSVADTLKNATRQSFSPIRSWWSRGKVRFSKNVQADLRFLSEQLVLPEFSPIWSCYLGLLVPRTATHSLISDASYEGLGGWSPRFEVQWRLTKDDLLELGFHLKIVEALTGNPRQTKWDYISIRWSSLRRLLISGFFLFLLNHCHYAILDTLWIYCQIIRRPCHG
jgi:hypothetical protein